MQFYRLEKHFSNKDTTVIVNGSNTYIHNGCQVFDINDAPKVLDDYGVSEEEWQQVLDAIGNKQFEVDRVSSECAFVYCKDINSDATISRMIDEVKWAYRYCLNISNDETVRRVIIDSKDSFYAYQYCCHVSNDKDMRQVIAEPEWAYRYCRHVSDDADVRQVIIDSEDSKWAYRYCKYISDDTDMRQVIVEPEWVHLYCCHVNKDAINKIFKANHSFLGDDWSVDDDTLMTIKNASFDDLESFISEAFEVCVITHKVIDEGFLVYGDAYSEASLAVADWNKSADESEQVKTFDELYDLYPEHCCYTVWEY